MKRALTLLLMVFLCLISRAQIVNRLRVDQVTFQRYARGRMQEFNPDNLALADSLYAEGVQKDNFRYNLAIQAGAPYLEWDWTGLEQYINTFSGMDYLMLSYNETPKVKLKATAYNISNPSYSWSSNAAKLASDQNGYFWVSQDVSSTPGYYYVYAQLTGNAGSKIQYAVRYYKEPKLIFADNLNDNQPITSIQFSESKRQEDVVFYVRTEPGDNRSYLRQVMCYTLSNSLTDYVRLERMAKLDEENLYRDQYFIVRKKAPASKRTGTLTVWPLGYPKLTKTIDITVE